MQELETLQYKYRLTLKDILLFNFCMRYQKSTGLRLFASIQFLMVIMATYKIIIDDEVASNTIAAFFFPCLIFIVIPFFTIKEVKANYLNHPQWPIEKEYEFSKEGLHFTYSAGYNWDEVKGVINTLTAFFILLPHHKFVLVPKRIFPSRLERRRFKELLKTQVGSEKWDYKFIDKMNKLK
ncbi:YcxB family protein [Paenibacillus peoriae]|uniref:YcxB family protein n=1 Tax=Paenibacillus peoriae TaxID=59893 RepID=UPI00026C63F2|nr:YcxB family protein [Paenibacillus peoriae]MEC0180047.1 YcxB family protein [Paenibacillus peoriae]